VAGVLLLRTALGREAAMGGKVRKFIDRHIKLIGAILVIAVIALWLLSQFVPALAKWMVEQDLLSVVIVALLTDVITRLVEIKGGEATRDVRVFSDQYEAYQEEIQRFVQGRRPEKVDLLEYSSATLSALLLDLRKCKCTIRLLIQHPETAITKHQTHRIKAQIEHLVSTEFKEYDPEKIEIRCYCAPGSLRGRNFGGELVSVGWYTYTSDASGIAGDTNPIINAYPDSEEGHHLHKLFDAVFEWLWNHPSTVKLGPPWSIPWEAYGDEE
jgi:hypothetical protein